MLQAPDLGRALSLPPGRSHSLSRGARLGRSGHSPHMEWLWERLPVMQGMPGSWAPVPGIERGSVSLFFERMG